jgi:hypothetical protein
LPPPPPLDAVLDDAVVAPPAPVGWSLPPAPPPLATLLFVALELAVVAPPPAPLVTLPLAGALPPPWAALGPESN